MLFKKDREKKLYEALKRMDNKCKALENRIIDLEESLSHFEDDVEAFKGETVTRDNLYEQVENIVDDKLPSNLGDMSYVFDNYDFDEFATHEDVENFIEDEGYVKEDDLEDCVNDHLHDTVVDMASTLDKRLEEVTNLNSPEVFRIFLNNLAKYVMEQTK